MFNVKGFIVNSSLTINLPGVNNAIGELSAHSLTYSREVGIYQNSDVNNLLLYTFMVEVGGVKTELPIQYSNKVLEVAQTIYNLTINHLGSEVTVNMLFDELMGEYVDDLEDFKLGTMVFDGTYYVPQWVYFKFKSNGTEVKIWFADEAFQVQYDEYEIEFIPPLDNLDDFFLVGSVVEDKLSNVTEASKFEKIQSIVEPNPQTYIKLLEYDYHDPHNDDRRIKTKWVMIGWGVKSANLDVIKNELINYILSNSNHNRDEWKEIFPDIFIVTEFVVAPFWLNYAIEPRQITPGMYSPVVDYNESPTILKTLLPDYSVYHIDTNTQVMAFPYKSLQCAIIGGFENRDQRYRITDFFPDYINVGTLSNDFNRMEQATKDWVLMMSELIIYSETADIFSSIPIDISKIERNGVLYLSKMMDNVQYLVVTKLGLESL